MFGDSDGLGEGCPLRLKVALEGRVGLVVAEVLGWRVMAALAGARGGEEYLIGLKPWHDSNLLVLNPLLWKA